jgi:predicted nucleic acid-binding protein
MELSQVFVDTNVFMYAVGRPHPLQAEARNLFYQALDNADLQLCTSSAGREVCSRVGNMFTIAHCFAT